MDVTPYFVDLVLVPHGSRSTTQEWGCGTRAGPRGARNERDGGVINEQRMPSFAVVDLPKESQLAVW